MATKSILKRGFKTKSEKLAIEFRESLGIHPCSPLCAFKLADHLGINIYKATEFIHKPEEIQLLSGNNHGVCEWSALTMTTKMGNRIIIHNPYNSIARQQSDIMHELAHIICKHESNHQEKSDLVLPLGLREYDEEQEEEAKCLGSTLQITRPGLLWARKRNMQVEEIAVYFHASTDMIRYRLFTSGVEKQISYLRNR